MQARSTPSRIAIFARPGRSVLLSAFVAVIALVAAPVQSLSDTGTITTATPAAVGILWAAGLALLGTALVVWNRMSAQLDRRAADLAARDVAIQRDAEQRAVETVDRFFVGLPAVVYRGELFDDGSLLFSFISEGVVRLSGLAPRQVCQPGGWRKRLGPEAQSVLDGFYRRLLTEGEAMAEYALERDGGGRVWLRDSARVAGLGQNQFAEVAGVMLDITRERQLNDRATMASKLETLGKITASIAHELTQPLGAIQVASETTLMSLEGQEGEAVGAARVRVGRINDQAERARQLIGQLRNFGRADTGPLVAVDLAKAINGAMLLAKPVLHGAGVEIVTRLPETAPLVSGQQVLLEQVFINVLVNARDALAQQPEETRRVEITATVDTEAQAVLLDFQDSGPGFPADRAARAFEAFFTTKPVGQGTGLGLSICREIITQFGGSISARNTDLGGCVSLSLPLWRGGTVELGVGTGGHYA